MKKINEENKKAEKEKAEEKPQPKQVDTTEQDKELTQEIIEMIQSESNFGKQSLKEMLSKKI